MTHDELYSQVLRRMRNAPEALQVISLELPDGFRAPAGWPRGVVLCWNKHRRTTTRQYRCDKLKTWIEDRVLRQVEDVEGSKRLACKVGSRVVAIAFASPVEVLVYGHGTYRRDEVPGPAAAGFVCAVCRERGHAVPRLELDNGEVVWGPECFLSSEAEFEHDERRVRLADLHADRLARCRIGFE
jgi:hypothetical protein